MTDKIFPEIGVVHFTKKKGCRKVIVKVKQNNEVYVTMPWLYAQKLAEAFVLSNTEWIINQQHKQKASVKTITESQKNITHFHDLEIAHSIDNSLRISVRNGIIKVIVPNNVAIDDQRIQDEITETLQTVLRKEAKSYLPQRVAFLAKQYGFSYATVAISSAKTRWGCCNTKGRIIFSLYLMTLPFDLIDYVILHELCHTKYMNHSMDFYALLNACCGGKNEQFRREMKKHPMDVFPKFNTDERTIS